MADIFDEIEVSEPDKKDIFDELEDEPRRVVVAPSDVGASMMFEPPESAFGRSTQLADLPPPGLQPISTMGGLGASLERGLERGEMIPDVLALPGLAKKATPTVGQERRAFERAMTDPAYFAASTIPGVSPLTVESRFGPTSQLNRIMFRPKTTLTETAKDVSEQQRVIASLPKSEAQVRMAKATTQADKWGAWLQDPVELTTSIVLESLPPSLVGAGAGAAGGPAGMAAGVGLASGLTEFSSTFLDEAGKQGYNVQDPVSLEKFLNDSKAYNTAIDKGITRAGIVGGVDAITGGTAGKFLKPALAQALKQRVIATGKELGVQGLGGSIGEGAAQIASGQPLDPFDIAMEAVAEIGSGPAEIAGNLRGETPPTAAPVEQPAAAVDEAAINSGLEKTVAGAPPAPAEPAPSNPVEAPVITEQAIEAMSPDEQGKIGHVPGMDYGLTLTQEDVPRLEAKYNEAAAEMQAAAKEDMAGVKDAGIKYKAAFGKYSFYGGALQGATRGTHTAAAGNLARYAADRAKAGNPIPGYTAPPVTEAAAPASSLTPQELTRLRESNQPIPAKALDDIGAPVPSGYVREGDFYVPTKARGAAPTTETASTAPTPTVASTTQRHHALPQQADVKDWTSATDEDQIVEMHSGIPLPKFANRKMSNLDKATTSHSSKVQKSFDEARRVQNEIRKQVGSERRQNAISVWREAAGDIPTLQAWAAAAKGKLFKQAAQDAQSLTAKEIAVANKVIAAFSVLEARGNRFDVLKGHRDNYVPHVWDVAKPGFGWGSTRLKERFRFSKARTFNNFFEGDQAGFKPKTLAIGKLLPAYIHEMNQTIADRQFVQDIAKGTMEDGSPMSVPTGNVTAVDNPSGKAVLVQPGTKKVADTSDYRVMSDQPALSNWIWKGNDTAGEPAFMKADLALHPDVFRRVNSMLGKSAIRTWYHDPVTGNARIPRAIVRGLDTAQAAMKREMFGLLAPFHQVQEGTHAIGHLVNPFFGTPKIDLRNPNQLDAARHGLMLLPDKATTTSYMEGVGASRSLLSRGIRKATPVGRAIADVIDGYQDYLFHQYIPGLKLKTYEALLSRNTKLYSKELASGEVTVADVKLVSAEQANAAYGHLNYALLDRNPTIQHLIQMAALAPDFLEARVRFTGQGIKGITSKTGHEQFKAIAILAVAQAGAAIILSSLLGVPWDPEHPFEVVYKGRRYAMRSVPEDIFGLLKDTRRFIYARVNPLTVKGAVQLATGLNYRGEKTTSMETMGELLAGYIPITARSIPGVRNLTETGRNNSITPLEQLAGSLGLRVSNYSPISETYKLAAEWMDSQKIKRDTGSYPVSKYQQLRYALEDGDMVRAREEYLKLKETMPRDKIYDGFKQSMSHPFTGNQDNDAKFSKSLKGYDRALYDLAVRKRKEIIGRFNGLPKQ